MKKQKHHDFHLDRIEGEFDELWVGSANVHIGRMNETGFWIGIDPPESSGLPRIMLNTGEPFSFIDSSIQQGAEKGPHRLKPVPPCAARSLIIGGTDFSL